MPWSGREYPSAMKNLSPQVREKALEIGNELLEQYEEPRAIRISIAQAKDWARRRRMDIWQNDGPSGRDQHVVSQDDRWAVRAEDAEQATETFPTKEEAVQRAREIASNQDSHLVIHDADGAIQDVVEPR